ncbi:MAG: hypothetical protein ACHRXM_02940 [Isosphaerales bacterium]
MERRPGFFHGSELPRLLILALVMLLGWGLFWQFAHKLPEPAEPAVTMPANPERVVADRSDEFETVKDRAPLTFRDNAAYSLLLSRARGKSPAELAAVARRDVVLAHLWQNPQDYRGVPIHLLGTALRVLRYESKLSKTGWLYEAWIITPETTRLPYACVFEEAPPGFPIGPNISERVVFNGYFLKIMKYQASDVARGAPVLVGRIGWEPHKPSSPEGINTTLWWSLVILGVLFFISLARWIYQARRLFNSPGVAPRPSPRAANEEIDPSSLNAWVRSMAPGDESDSDQVDDAS